MKIFQLEANMLGADQQKLFEFEKRFVYPLGATSKFRIEHGPDYTSFYRAIGKPITVAAQKDAEIVGVISVALREVSLGGRFLKFAYIGDLKVDPRWQSTSVFYKLAKRLQSLLTEPIDCAYAVVMNGTPSSPSSYSGRLGIPHFKTVNTTHVLRFLTSSHETSPLTPANEHNSYSLYCLLEQENAILSLANVQLRSNTSPMWLNVNDKAIGLIEDTMRAKRLYLDDGSELLSAHLSYFAFADVSSAMTLISHAVTWAHKKGFPALFVSLSPQKKHLLKPLLSKFQFDESLATIYATDDIGGRISINTSEI